MHNIVNTKDCPFCSSEVEQSTFYSNEHYLAIYNIAPVLPGHSLVIPRTHITSILQLSSEDLAGFFETARTTLRILMKAFNTDSFDWSVQEKPEAGQTIEHLHLHIVPRIKGDLKYPGDWYPLIQHNDENLIDSINRTRLNEGSMEMIVNELRNIATTITHTH